MNIPQAVTNQSTPTISTTSNANNVEPENQLNYNWISIYSRMPQKDWLDAENIQYKELENGRAVLFNTPSKSIFEYNSSSKINYGITAKMYMAGMIILGVQNDITMDLGQMVPSLKLTYLGTESVG